MKRWFIIFQILLTSSLEMIGGCGGKAKVDLNIEDWSIEYEFQGSIVVVQADGDGKKEVETLPKSMITVFFNGRRSPIENRWVYASTKGGNADIWTYDYTSPNPKQLTNNKFPDNMPEWSLDGKKIIFSSKRSGTWQIWAMNADGENVIKITDQPKGAFGAKFASDGKRIAYLSNQQDTRPISYDLIVADYDGKNEVMIVSEAGIGDFAWIGESIIYSVVGEIKIKNSITTGILKNFRLDKIDKKYQDYGVHGIIVRPDNKAIACIVEFLGSSTGIKNPGEIFIVPVDGRESDIIRVQQDGKVNLIRWVSTK